MHSTCRESRAFTGSFTERDFGPRRPTVLLLLEHPRKCIPVTYYHFLLSPTGQFKFRAVLRAAGLYELGFRNLHHNGEVREDDGGLLAHEIQASIEREKDG